VRLKVKITKTKLKQIIEEELKRLAEGEVIPVDFGTKTVGDQRAEISVGEQLDQYASAVEKNYRDAVNSFKGMIMFIKDVREEAESVAQYARQHRSEAEGTEQIEVDMLEITTGLDGLFEDLLNPDL